MCSYVLQGTLREQGQAGLSPALAEVVPYYHLGYHADKHLQASLEIHIIEVRLLSMQS